MKVIYQLLLEIFKTEVLFPLKLLVEYKVSLLLLVVVCKILPENEHNKNENRIRDGETLLSVASLSPSGPLLSFLFL